MKSYFFLAIAFLAILSNATYSQRIVQVIPLPNSTYFNAAWGITADASNVYLASNTSDTARGRRIYKLDFSGQRVDSILLPRGVNSNQGLARDDSGNYYFLRRYTAAGTIMKFTSSGVLVDSLRLPSSKFPGGLAWAGSHVWFTIYSPDAEAGLYKVHWGTKQVVDTILVPTKQPYGMTWDGTFLYYVENGFQADPQGIFKVNPATGDTVGFIAAPVDPNGTRPNDAAWDGRYMWLLAEPVGANTGRALYKYDLSASGTPDIHFSRDSVNFGYRRIGRAHIDSILVANTGSAPLVIDSVETPLSILWGHFGGALPLTLQPGTFTTFSVGFDPMAFTSYSASFRMHSNDPDEQVKILFVRGFGIYPTPVVDTDSTHNFGARRAGSMNPWTLTIRNLGAQQLSVSSITSDNSAYRLDSVQFPILLDSLQTKSLRVWFTPSSTIFFAGTLTITSNASNGTTRRIQLQGSGDATPAALGEPLWTYTVPQNPRTTSNAKLMKGVRAISDINGDGKADVVVSSENYWTMALNGNASVSNDTLWAFNTYIANTSAGSIGSAGDYSHQKALAVADLNRDNLKDVIIGTGGGNEHVYALNGRNGRILWQFGTDHPDSFSLGDFTGVDASMDFTGDGVPEVLGAAAATDVGGVGGRRSVYLFDGTNGQIRWVAPLLGFTHAVAAIPDVNGDAIPDAVGGVGEPSYKFVAFSGANGNQLWEFPVTPTSGGGKEVLPWTVTGTTPDVIVSAFWGPICRVNGVNGMQRWSYSTGGRGVLQMMRLKDVTGDGIDEIVAVMLLGGAVCLNGTTGQVVWALPTGNTMGVAVLPDVNRDGFDDIVLAVQDQGAMIIKGNDGSQLALYATGTQQTREVAVVPDIDGNSSVEIITGGQQGNVALLSGGTLVTDVEGEPKQHPERFELGQNYPNPFNPSTTVSISIPEQSDFTLRIYDLLGKELRSLSYERVPAGVHTVVWDGTNSGGVGVASGVYLMTLRANSFSSTKKMILLR